MLFAQILIFFNRPGVAEADLQSPLYKIHSFSSFIAKKIGITPKNDPIQKNQGVFGNGVANGFRIQPMILKT